MRRAPSDGPVVGDSHRILRRVPPRNAALDGAGIETDLYPFLLQQLGDGSAHRSGTTPRSQPVGACEAKTKMQPQTDGQITIPVRCGAAFKSKPVTTCAST